MAEETTVVVRLVGDASGLKKAIDGVDKELGELVVQTNRAQAALGNNLGKAAQKATGRMNQYSDATNRMMKTSGAMRGQMQNLGYQVADVAVQLEMGTSAARVFAQQGSQILAVFGAWGAIAGAAVAVLGAMAPALLGAKDEALDLADAMDELAEATDGFVRASGEIAQTLSVEDVEEKITSAGLSIAAMFENLENQGNLFQRWFGDDPVELIDTIRYGLEQWNYTLEEANKAAQDQYGVTYDTLQQIVAAQEELTKATTNEDRLSSARDLFDLMFKYRNELDISAESLLDLNRLISGLRQAMSATNDDAEAFAEAMRVAAGVSQNLDTAYEAMAFYWEKIAQNSGTWLSNLIAAGATVFGRFASGAPVAEQGRGGAKDPRSFETDSYWRDKYFPDPFQPGNGQSKSGGGGKSEADKAQEALEKYEQQLAETAEAAKLFGSTMEEAFAGIASSSIDSFVDSLARGEASFKEFARAFLVDMAKMILRAAILNALMAQFGGTPGSAVTSVQRIVQSIAGIAQVPLPTANAKGNAFSGGNVIPFARGGVVSGASLFPMTGGKTGMMGEAGPEAIMPLSRNSQGQLGVAGPSITINNNAGVDVAVVRADEELIEIAVNRSVKESQARFNKSMATGQGGYARSFEQGYTARRRAT